MFEMSPGSDKMVKYLSDHVGAFSDIAEPTWNRLFILSFNTIMSKC